MKISFKKLRRVYLFILLLLICFNSSKIVYCAVSSPSNINQSLSDEENEEIKDYTDLKEMISQVFDLGEDKGTEDLSDPIKLMLSLINRVIVYYDDFTSTSLYHLMIGLALIFLICNFSLQVYEEFSINNNIYFNSNTMIRKYIRFIFALLLMVNLKNIVLFILGFFRFILSLSSSSINKSIFNNYDKINNLIDSERIAYEILKENGIVESKTLLDEVIIRSKESAVRTTYMIPWVFNWISKMAIVVVIFVNSMKLLVHSVFYVLSIGDFFGNLKKSKFIEYTKILLSLVIEETVLVVVLHISNMLLNPYLKELLINNINGTTNMSFLTLSMIFISVQMSRVIVIISSFGIAKKIIGVE